jgi:hypothetical protein
MPNTVNQPFRFFGAGQPRPNQGIRVLGRKTGCIGKERDGIQVSTNDCILLKERCECTLENKAVLVSTGAIDGNKRNGWNVVAWENVCAENDHPMGDNYLKLGWARMCQIRGNQEGYAISGRAR